MDPQTLILIALFSFLVSIISAIGGYGGFLMIVSLSFFTDIKSSIAISTLFFIFLVINKAILYFKNVDWEFFKFTLLGIIPFALIGLYLFNIVPPKVINYLLVLVGIYLILSHYWKLPKIRNFT
ncbi:MAG: sulfite exporter TauE/SafE family protein, partial [Candidatus Peregrinibacteria bacterium]|nr:sulfite exporter TauE/SafE family protein [Candidatus Peregrinibacteria bacterium]